MKNVDYFTFEGDKGSAEIDKQPDLCPFCKKHMTPDFIKAYKPTKDYSGQETLEIVFKCTNENCRGLFLAYYDNGISGMRAHSDWFRFNGSGGARYREIVEFSEIIDKISPNFSIIYNQARAAEGLKFLEICGPGYRRALEFLVKDYLIAKFPKDSAAIKGEFLGQSIQRISHQDIKDCAERAAWLGNDETHYVKKHTAQDLSDLKELISMIIDWVNLTEKTAHYKKTLSSKK